MMEGIYSLEIAIAVSHTRYMKNTLRKTSRMSVVQHLFLPYSPFLPPARRIFSNCADRKVLFTCGISFCLLHMPGAGIKDSNNEISVWVIQKPRNPI